MNAPTTTKTPSLMSLVVRGALWVPRRLAAAVKPIKTPQNDINDFLNEHGPHFTLGDVNRFTNALRHPGGSAETVDNLIEAYERKQAPSTKV